MKTEILGTLAGWSFLLSSLGFFQDKKPRCRSPRREARVLIEDSKNFDSIIGSSLLAISITNTGSTSADLYKPLFAARNLYGRMLDLVRSNRLPARAQPARLTLQAIGATRLVAPVNLLQARITMHRWLRANRDLLNSRAGVLSAKIENVDFGLLAYDQYLRDTGEMSVNCADDNFQRVFFEFGTATFWWKKYLARRKISAVIGSRAYASGIVTQVAAGMSIPTFEAGLGAIKRLRAGTPQETTWQEARKIFGDLSPLQKSAAVEDGLEICKRILSGHVAGLPQYSKGTGLRTEFSPRAGRPGASGEKGHTVPKVLVAPHASASDSPHVAGSWLFADYGEWLDHIGEFSTNSKCEWLLKPHPNAGAKGLSEIATFHRKYPHFTIISEKQTHQDLVADGLSYVVTVRGTIAFEMALLGVTTVNAAPTNPHASYGFCISPRSFQEYVRAVQGFENGATRAKIIQEELAEFAFMRNVYFLRDLFTPNKVAELPADRDMNLLNWFLNNHQPQHIADVTNAIQWFINSNLPELSNHLLRLHREETA